MAVSKSRLLVGLTVGILAASFASIFIRFAQSAGMPTLVIAAWRLIFASLILLPYSWATRRQEIRSLSHREWRWMGLAGFFLGLHFATWISSLQFTSVASAAVLVSMGPLFVALGSWLVWGLRPGILMATGIGMAVVGTTIIAYGDFGHGENALLGDLLALTGAVFMAGYLMIGRGLRSQRTLTTYVAVVYGFAMVTLLGLVAVARVPLLGYNKAAYGWSLAMAIGPQLIGHSTLNWALAYLSATFVSVATLAEPIGSSILAYGILGEAVTAFTIIGGALVLLGIFVASRAELN